MEYSFTVPEYLLPKKQDATSPSKALEEPMQASLTLDNENALERTTEGLERLQRVAKLKQDDQSRELQMYSQWQNNLAKSRLLKAEILKSIALGENIYPLFLKAIETISRLTDDSQFSAQISKDLPAIYGEVLQEPTFLDEELEEVERKLDWAENAIERETLPEGRITRIKHSKRALEARRDYLRKKLGLPVEEAAALQKPLKDKDAAGQALFEISQGIITAGNPYEILFTAAKEIAKLTPSEDFFKTYFNDLKRIHGLDNKNPETLAREVENVKHRLAMLKQFEKQVLEQTSLEAEADLNRVRHAIAEHEARLKEYTSLLTGE